MPLQEADFDGVITDHIQLVTSLIEGRAVSLGEVVEMLRRVLRQHSIVRERALDYVVRSLHEEPP
ncbi:MAG: hypothetical protein GY725_26020 [bacterium]|nr:hypothetical protein [bacterium]